ncbi:hypothetical protein BASA81_010287 [Batrachochytrium salamandrivorans]|nr:hypothetical protein BASA81_010287 [Batrachochytrium salamandrivorans]
MEQLLVGLRSDQTQVRTQHEAQYEAMKASAPDLLAEQLSLVLCSNLNFSNDNTLGLLQLAAVLLRRLLENETESGAWAKLSPPERRSTIQSQILQAFSHAQSDKKARNGLVHVLAQLSRLEGEAKKEWPELFKTMFTTTQPTMDAKSREGGFELFAQVAEYAPGMVTPHARQIGQVMALGLTDESSVEVRMASLGAMSSLIVSISDPNELEVFRPSVPVMLACLKSTLDLAVSSQNAQMEDSCRLAIASLTEICTAHSKFFRGPEFAELAQSMISIAAAKQGLEMETRSIALEFLVACAEQMPSFLRKEHDFASNLLPLCMELMCEREVEPDMQGWTNTLGEAEEDGDEDEVLANAAENSAHRFALALGGKTVLPRVLELVPGMISNSDWRVRRSAVQTLSLVAEGCGKRMYAKLKDVVQVCTALKQDAHPKVRYAVVHLLGRMCLDFGDESKPGVMPDHSQSGPKPTFQKKFAKQVLPLLSDFLRDDNIRVATHSAGSLVNYFIEYGDLVPEDVSFALDALLEGLLVHLQKGTLPIKEEALVAISGISTVAGPGLFVRYYDTLMPIALGIASEPSPSEHDEKVSQVKGRALECAGLMAVAVGKERFNPTARGLIELVLPLCHSSHPDSTLRRFALSSLVRVCEVLKEDFLPVLPQLVGDLIKGCKEDISVEVIDANKTQEYENQGFQVVQLQVRGEGAKSVSINSSAVQEISTCSFALYSFAHSLGISFAPYAPQTFEAFLPLVDCDGLEAVRNCAVLGLPHLVKSMSQHSQPASEMLAVSVTTLLNKLVELENSGMECEEEDEGQFQMDMETSLHVVESLVALIQHSYQSGGARDNDPYLAKRISHHPPTFDFGQHFTQVLSEACEALKRRVEWIVESRTAYDQEDEDRFAQRDAQHVEIAERLLDCVGYLIKLDAHAFANVAAVRTFCFPLFPLLLGETNVDAELDFRRLGVCLLDDYLEFYSSQQEEPDRLLREYAYDMLLSSAQTDNNALCRASVWGLGIAAMYGGQSFSPKVMQAVQVLGHSVEVRRALMAKLEAAAENEGNEDLAVELGLVVDNALSALEKIASTRPQELVQGGIAPELVMKRVIDCLPQTADAEEARVLNCKMHKYLTRTELGSLLLSQVEYGKASGLGEWNEEDSFLHPRQRMELFQMYATGELKSTPEMATVLTELAAWAAKVDLSVV